MALPLNKANRISLGPTPYSLKSVNFVGHPKAEEEKNAALATADRTDGYS
jgi:hypothetical protein